MRQVDAIYLNKRGHNSDTSKWAYYRISSAGGMGHNIEMCLVKWPSFEHIDEVLSEHAAVVVNPGETGFASAYPNILKVLKSKAGIDHKDDDLIGIRARLPPHPLSLAWFIFYAPFLRLLRCAQVTHFYDCRAIHSGPRTQVLFRQGR